MSVKKKPLVVVTRKLPDSIETRMRELFDARLNLDDTPLTGRIIDLQGNTAFPGFTDSHYHLTGVGQRERTLNLENTKNTDLQDFLQKVKAATAAKNTSCIGTTPKR